MKQDIVAQLPDELAQINHDNGSFPDNVTIEPGYFCIWGDRFFIHTRATIPLKDIEEGFGFGLWVEISKEDFDIYMATAEDDELYKIFKTRGKLANNWPGFQDTLGVEVTVRPISLNDKVYITEVHMDRPRDPIFESALLTQKGEHVKLQEIEKLVRAYISEYYPE